MHHLHCTMHSALVATAVTWLVWCRLQRLWCAIVLALECYTQAFFLVCRLSSGGRCGQGQCGTHGQGQGGGGCSAGCFAAGDGVSHVGFLLCSRFEGACGLHRTHNPVRQRPGFGYALQKNYCADASFWSRSVQRSAGKVSENDFALKRQQKSPNVWEMGLYRPSKNRFPALLDHQSRE